VLYRGVFEFFMGCFLLNVVLLGASDKKDSYSYKAFHLLLSKGHEVFPVNPRLTAIDGAKVYESIAAIKNEIDTITIYVSKEISAKLKDEILGLGAKRIIFNPGAENTGLIAEAAARGIVVEQACTLVLLNTNQF
jgi:uncharacterized protein